MTCTYTFTDPAGKKLTITGKNAFKAYLANGGLQHLAPKRLAAAIGQIGADQTNTPAFKRFFKQSKVVDAEGKPLMVYHGGNDFTVFDQNTAKEGGFYFTPNKFAASQFERKGGKLFEVYLSIQNPKEVSLDEFLVYDEENNWYEHDEDIKADVIEQAKAEGYDGIIVRDVPDAGMISDQWIAFNPEQIKSATENIGTFDRTNPDTRYSVGADGTVTAEFGPVTEAYRNDPAAAIDYLLKQKTGEAIVNHPTLGDVSIVYGDGSYGLSHIAKRRGEDFMARLPELLMNGDLYSKPDQPTGRLFVGNDSNEATIRMDWNGQAKTWLISAYEKYPDLTKAPAPKASTRSDTIAQRSGRLNTEGLRNAVAKGALSPVVSALIDNGVIVLHQTTATLPDANARKVRGVQAITTADGKIHLVAASLTAENAQPVLWHEMFHKGGERLIGSKEWGNLMGRGASLYRQAEQSTGKAREFFDKARTRVAAAKRQGAVATNMEVEEFLAYAIEEYETAPASIRKWVDDLIGLIKAWFQKTFGKQLGDVTPAQLSAIAKMALMDVASDRRGEMFGALGTVMSATEQTNTPAFKRFFKQSKVVDEAGEPLMLYHGTNNLFSRFSKRVFPNFKTAQEKLGFFFTKSSDYAGQYADREGAQIMPVYLSLQNPKYEPLSKIDEIENGTNQQAGRYVAQLKRDGYDGIIFGDMDEIVAFEPTQIKSATGNNGEFDPTNPDIRYSVTPEQQEAVLQEATDALNEKVKEDFIGSVVGDISLGAKLIVHPRTVAAVHKEFTPVYRTAISQMETRDKNIAELGEGLLTYNRLEQAGKENVNKVLELGRLTSQTYTAAELRDGVGNPGEKSVVVMVDGKPQVSKVEMHALLTEVGEVVKLSDEEIAAYMGLRETFDNALDKMRDQTLTEMGFGGFAPMEGMKPLMLDETEDDKLILKGSVYTDEERAIFRSGDKAAIAEAMQKNPVAVIIKKFDGAKWNPELMGYEFDPRQREALEKEMGAFMKKSAARQILDLIDDKTPQDKAERLRNIANFIAEIEQAKRAGYVPFARYGDYVVTVKEKVADVEFLNDTDGYLIARGLPDSFAPDLMEMGAEETKEGWRIKDSQRSAVERMTEKTVYSTKVETGLTDIIDEKRAKKVDDIKAVKEAIDKARAEWVGDNPNRRIVAFKTREKKTDQPVKLSDVDALAEVANIDNGTWDWVRDKLTDAMKAKGFRRHFFHSDNVPGYTGDFERAMADYVIGMSGYLSRRQHMKRWENAVTNIGNKPKLYEYASKYRDYVNDPQEELALVRQIGFFSYISGVLASAFANLTQVPMMAVPTLAQVAPTPLVLKEVGKAYKDAALMLSSTVGIDMFDPEKAPEDVRAILKEAWAEGSFVPLETFDLMMTARQRNVGARKGVKLFNDATQVVSVAFTFAERMNRLVTFIAAARLAEKRAVQENARNVLSGDALARSEVLRNWSPKAFAEWAVDESQYRMGKANRPTTMRGVGAAIMQFKGFMLQTFEAWYRMAALHGRNGKFAAAASVLTIASLAGVWGLPGADDLRKLIEALYKQITDKDLDLKTELRSFIARTSGSNAVAQIVSKGASYPLGVDLTRVGMGSIVPDSPLAAAGIPFDMLVGRPKRAFEKGSTGDYLGAAAEFTPNWIKNYLVAGSWALEGVRDKRGNLILRPEDLSASDLVMKSQGFQPSIVTDVRDYEYAQRRQETAVDNLKRSYTNKIAKVMHQMETTTDPDKLAKLDQQLTDIYNDLDEHNASAPPEQVIKITARTLRNKIMRESEGVMGTWGKERKAARGAAEELRGVFGLSQEEDE